MPPEDSEYQTLQDRLDEAFQHLSKPINLPEAVAKLKEWNTSPTENVFYGVPIVGAFYDSVSLLQEYMAAHSYHAADCPLLDGYQNCECGVAEYHARLALHGIHPTEGRGS